MNTPADDNTPRNHLSAQDIADMPEEIRKHRVDPDSIRHTRALSDAMGLERLGVHLVRLPSGRAASEYHMHHHEEEFVYVIAGRGRVEIGLEETELQTGDIVGFPCADEPHRIHNPYPEDLYLLVAGERADFDVCDYPRAGMRLIRGKGTFEYTDIPADE